MKRSLRRFAEFCLVRLAPRLMVEVEKIQGEVADGIPDRPDGIYIDIDHKDCPLRRVFPKDRLQAADACFEGARIELAIYQLGTVRLTTIRRVGPSLKELLDAPWPSLDEETIKALEER